MSIKINIDVSGIAAQMKEFAMEVEQDLQRAVADLAAMTNAKVAELAAAELKTSLKTLQENLGYEEISPGIWVVWIDEAALFIEDGVEASTDMKPGLLKGATKISKDGHRYRSIPFDHSKAPSQMSAGAQQMVTQIKQFLRRENVPFKKIEKDANGSPRVGKLHKFDIESDPPTSRASHPGLQGLSIYQSKDSSGNVRRDILTFRTVSDGPASKGKWIHPGVQPKNFLDRASEWAIKEWEDKILPEVLGKWK